MGEMASGIIALSGAGIVRTLESMTMVAIYALVAVAELRESSAYSNYRANPNMGITAGRVCTIASHKM